MTMSNIDAYKAFLVNHDVAAVFSSTLETSNEEFAILLALAGHAGQAAYDVARRVAKAILCDTSQPCPKWLRLYKRVVDTFLEAEEARDELKKQWNWFLKFHGGRRLRRPAVGGTEVNNTDKAIKKMIILGKSHRKALKEFNKNVTDIPEVSSFHQCLSFLGANFDSSYTSSMDKNLDTHLKETFTMQPTGMKPRTRSSYVYKIDVKPTAFKPRYALPYTWADMEDDAEDEVQEDGNEEGKDEKDERRDNTLGGPFEWDMDQNIEREECSYAPDGPYEW